MSTDLDKIKQGLIVVGKAHTETYLQQLDKDNSIPNELKPTFANIINNSFEDYKNQVMQLDDVSKVAKFTHDVSDEARDDHGRWTSGSSSQSTEAENKKETDYTGLTAEEKAKAEAEGKAEFAQELDNKQQNESYKNTIKTIALGVAAVALAPMAGVLLPTTIAVGVGSTTIGIAAAGVTEMALAGLGTDMLWGAIFQAGFGAAHSLGIDKQTTKLFYDTMAAVPGFVASVDKYINMANAMKVVSDDTIKGWNNFKTQYDSVISSVNSFFEQTQNNPDKWTTEAKRRDRTANNKPETNYPSYSDVAPTIDLEANKLFKNSINPVDYFKQVADQTAKEIEIQFLQKYPSLTEDQKTILHNAILTALKNVKLELKSTKKFKKASDDMTSLNLFVPLTKIDEEKRLVYGVATSEVPDRTNEICDYATTKPMYEKWSSDFHKATDGKSLGNLRSMHGNVAAGKVTSVAFNDEAKQIEICAKVVDDNEWKKVLEGVYTGFSQGGAYEKRWKDEDSEYTRYTANPSEISLVDLPCLPTATFKVIKADGMEVEKSFVSVEEQNVNKIEEEFETKIVSKRDGSAHNSIEELKAHHIKLEAEKLAKQAASAALDIVGSLEKTFGETTTEVEKLEASVEELAKVGARNSKSDKERIQAVHDHACALGADCKNNDSDNDGDSSSDTDMDGKAVHAEELKKRADELLVVKEELAKANALVAAKDVLIETKFLPLLEKMQKSIEALEAQPTPLPWQVGTKVVSKTQDIGVGEQQDNFNLQEALAKLSDQERTELMMKATLRNPIPIR